MIELKSLLVVERPTICEWLVRRDEKTFEIDLTQVHLAETRREELVVAQGRSLLELANAFDIGYDAACKLHSRVIYESEMATIASRKRKAILLRDEFPQIIKDRGLGTTRSPVGAEDIRDNLYYEDEEFVKTENYRASLEAIKELLFGKMMSMSRLCRRTEVLLQRRETYTNGIEDTDPGGKYLEEKMESVIKQIDNRVTFKVAIPARKGFASKEKD